MDREWRYRRMLEKQQEMHRARLASVQAKIDYVRFIRTVPGLEHEDTEYYKKYQSKIFYLEGKRGEIDSKIRELQQRINDLDSDFTPEWQPSPSALEEFQEESLEDILKNLHDNEPGEYEKLENEMQRLDEENAQAGDAQVWKGYTFEELKPYFLQSKRTKSAWRIV